MADNIPDDSIYQSMRMVANNWCTHSERAELNLVILEEVDAYIDGQTLEVRCTPLVNSIPTLYRKYYKYGTV